MGDFFSRIKKSKEIWYRIAFAVLMLVIFQPMIVELSPSNRESDWQLLFWFGFVLIITAQMSLLPAEFFTGSGPSFIDVAKYYILGIDISEEAKNRQLSKEDVGFWRLMPSAFITWIFAKSIRNASVLAAIYGELGAAAYAMWYLSFFSASLVIYILRVRNNSASLPGSIEYCYGPTAQFLLCLGLLYRLNNEVWSNSVIVASFYGDTYSASWWLAVIFSTLIPATYVFIGGMRSSLVSDVIQAFLAFFFLFFILGIIGSKDKDEFDISYEPTGGWAEGGVELFIVAVIQGLYSYPFHDPVLTDRCYLSTPKKMLLSFFVGGLLSMAFILLFGIIGIYGKQSVGSGEPFKVAGSLSAAAYTLLNFVFMTSSMSTLDSTFTSTAKIFGLDMLGWFRYPGDQRQVIAPLTLDQMQYVTIFHIWVGRIAIIAMAIVGTLPLLADTEALNATLVSGTTVMGLGPPIYLMIFWKWHDGSNFGWRKSPLCFIFSFLCGTVYGALYQANSYKNSALFGELSDNLTWGIDFGVGSYKILLGTNVWGHLCCTIAAIIGFILDQYVLKFYPPLEKPANDNKYNNANRKEEDDVKLSKLTSASNNDGNDGEEIQI